VWLSLIVISISYLFSKASIRFDDKFTFFKEEKRDMTRKRISIIISKDPVEEKKIQFSSTKEALNQENEANDAKQIYEGIEKNKNIFLSEEIMKKAKVKLVVDEGFFNFLSTQESHKFSVSTINFAILLNENELKSLKNAKALIEN
jgi:hypothetical protein